MVNLSGAQNRKIITDANGNYRFENVETGGFYTVRPSRADYSFSPAERSFSQLGNNTEATFTGLRRRVVRSIRWTRRSISSGNTISIFWDASLTRAASTSGAIRYSSAAATAPASSGARSTSRRLTSCRLSFRRLADWLMDSIARVTALGRSMRSSCRTRARSRRDVRRGHGDWAQQLAANKQAFVDCLGAACRLPCGLRRTDERVNTSTR